MVPSVRFRVFGRRLGAKAERNHLVDAVCLPPRDRGCTREQTARARVDASTSRGRSWDQRLKETKALSVQRLAKVADRARLPLLPVVGAPGISLVELAPLALLLGRDLAADAREAEAKARSGPHDTPPPRGACQGRARRAGRTVHTNFAATGAALWPASGHRDQSIGPADGSSARR